MTRIEKLFFHLCMVLSVAAMVAGHTLIINQGKWFIPGKEKFNLHTRWVSDFAAAKPEGWWIVASIVLFAIAWILFMRPQFRNSGDHFLGHVRWGWNLLLVVGVTGGLLLVAMYDMSPPQFTVKEPSWIGKWLGENPERVQMKRTSRDYDQIWYHSLGFKMFIVSFVMALVTAAVDKCRTGQTLRARRDWAALVLALVAMGWLFSQHKSLAGIPQRFLLLLIFWWVWQEALRSGKSQDSLG
jgi:hypothetical protein